MQKKFTDGLDESNGIILSDSDEFIRSRVFTVRGVQVMLDSDLAKIYQVETRVFNQAVKRNENRFPQGFRFQLTMEEYRSLTSQIVISKKSRWRNPRRTSEGSLCFYRTRNCHAFGCTEE